MTLEQKLCARDERIGQFQKVADYAYKRLGWDKYDCAGLMNKLGNVSFTGAGIYYTIDGIIGVMNGNIRGLISIPFGLFFMGGGFIDFYGSAKINHLLKQLEEKNIEQTHAPFPPRFYAKRPIQFICFPAMSISLAAMLPTPLDYALVFVGAYAFFSDAASYFRNTTNNGGGSPKKKKTLADAWQWAKEKLLPAPAPVPEKVEVRYRTPMEVGG